MEINSQTTAADSRNRMVWERLTARINSFAAKGVQVAIIVLVLSASAKLASIIIADKTPSVQGVMIAPSVALPFISERFLLEISIVIEYAVAAFLFFANNVILRFALIAWISSVFLIYHFLLYFMVHQPACHCLGIWGVNRQSISDLIGLVLLIILVIIGWGGITALAVCRLVHKGQ